MRRRGLGSAGSTASQLNPRRAFEFRLQALIRQLCGARALAAVRSAAGGESRVAAAQTPILRRTLGRASTTLSKGALVFGRNVSRRRLDHPVPLGRAAGLLERGSIQQPLTQSVASTRIQAASAMLIRPSMTPRYQIQLRSSIDVNSACFRHQRSQGLKPNQCHRQNIA